MLLLIDIDGDQVESTLASFLLANLETFTDEDRAALEALQVGQEFLGGGGAAPDWAVRRIA